MIVKLSDYSGSVVSGNWTPALDAAWTAVKATGGKIIFDVSCELRGRTTFTDADIPGKQVDLTLESEPGVEILVNTSDSELPMNVGDKGKFVVRGLNFKGDGSGGNQDCGQLLILSNCIRAIIDDCVFAGIRSNANGIIEAGSGTNLLLCNSIMSGNAGRCVRANGAKSLEVNNILFLDYYSLNGFYHSKTGAGVSWIYAHNPPAGVLGAETPVIKVVNSQFDEASFFGMEIDGYPVFEAERNRINNSSSGSAAGFRLNNIKHAILKQNHVGYNNVDIPLFKATSVERLRVTRMGKDSGPSAPHRYEVDAATNTNLKVFDSPGLTKTII